MGIGRNSIIGLSTDLVVFGLGILLSIVLRRVFGLNLSGVYALVVTSNILLANITGLSVGTAATTFLARDRYSLGQVNTIAILLALGLGGLCLLITVLVFPLLQDNLFRDIPFSYLLVALALVPATIYQIYWNAIMTGLNRLILLNKVNLVQNLGSTLLMLLAVGVFNAGLPGFLLAWTLSLAGGALAMLVIAWRLARPAWPPSAEALRAMLGFGLRGHGNNVAYNLILRFDVYVVNPLLGTGAVGAYSLATSLAEKLWVLTGAVNASSRATIAQLAPQESALLTAKVVRTSLLVSLAVAAPFAAVSPWLIPWLYGAAFAAAVLPLVILLAGTIFLALMLVLNNYVIGQMQRPGLLSLVSWLQLGFGLPAYLLLIPWLGIPGAALASTLTYFVAFVAVLVLFLRHSHLPLALLFVPQATDLQDYLRVLRAAFTRSLAFIPGRLR